MKLIYAADDEKNIRGLLKSFLENEGYAVEVFETGDLLFEKFLKAPADLVILDIMMPGNDGFAICSKIRQLSNVPIIMLTARDSDSDYVSGLALGSDDYFTKPFRPLKLVMRVKAIFRRIDMEQQALKDDKITLGNLYLLSKQRSVLISENEIPLTLIEFEFLDFLFQNQHRAVSRDEILNQVWGYDSMVETRVTDDTVKRLRKKLSDYGSNVFIETVRGFGFKLKVNQL